MKPKTKPTRSAPVWGNLAYGLFLLCALGVGSVFGWASRNKILTDIVTNPIGFLTMDPRRAFGGDDSTTLLILGCDEDRLYHGVLKNGHNVLRKYSRSDMILIARLDFLKNEITGISIPRDTMCNVPGWPNPPHKINSYHAIAKESQADEAEKQAVEYLIPQVHIDKVVVLDFEAMQRLVNMVGGVTVNVPEKMDYDDTAGFLHIHLTPGTHHLDGYNAMGYVRFRHDTEGDFGRQQRQKDLLNAFKESAFRNVMALPEVLSQGKIALNNALNDDQLEALAAFARRVPKEKIRMGMVPVVDGPHTFLLLDKKRLPKVLEQYGFIAPQAPSETAATQ
ncbi:MAG TPA: LCP family protein [Fimbriimonas sp.]|nr:LCP family protein [Fimbriimonas sp.]